MPKCEICGKELKNPNSKSHINSKFHQEKLKSLQLKRGKESKVKRKDRIVIKKAKENKITKTIAIKQIQHEILELKKITSTLERRISTLEKQLNLKEKVSILTKKANSSEIFKDEMDFKKIIIRIVNERSDFKQVKNNLALKTVREIILKEYNISEKNFEEQILRLYRKQLIDLQPGGNPKDYHLISPTGMKFYYLAIKN